MAQGAPPSHCLTLPANGTRRREIITPVHISVGFEPTTTPQAQWPVHTQFNALWDTGATGCVISEKVINACGLQPTGFENVHGVHGVESTETFFVNIGLPNGLAFSNRRVFKGKCGGADVIIGMDIITMGDFSITNVGGQTVFSFRIPSQGTIDYVKDVQRQQKAAQQGASAFRPPNISVNPASRKGRR